MKRKLNKFKISIVVILVVFALSITVFGRYIYNSIREAYFMAEQFYFSSDILTVNGAEYQYNGWSGQEEYQIKFDLKSYESEWAKLDYDLDYTVTCSTNNPDKIKCSINNETETTDTAEDGIVTLEDAIPGSNSSEEIKNLSSIIIKVNPKDEITEDDVIKVYVTASTTEPYQKTISCEFTLNSETSGAISYTIEDVANREYALLKLTCPGEAATVTLTFDPTIIRIDSNDEVYINSDASQMETVTINGSKYVKKIVYDMPAEITKYVKFYKVDKTQNYTYPSGSATSQIQVTAQQTT